MAKSADAADLKSAGRKRLWEFKSPSGHQDHPLNMLVIALAALKGISNQIQDASRRGLRDHHKG
jgi:hypothetical protein